MPRQARHEDLVLSLSKDEGDSMSSESVIAVYHRSVKVCGTGTNPSTVADG
jgi:hypothetical protein